MKSGGKNQTKLLVTVLGSMGLLFAYATTIGKDSIIGRHTSDFFTKAKSYLPESKSSAPAAKTSSGKKFSLSGLFSRFNGSSIEDEELKALRDACMDAMFLEKSGFHFSQSRWGGAAVPYQFRDLKLIGPEVLPPNAGDERRGIDLRVGYRFEVVSYRRYDPEHGWETWRFDEPPNLVDMSFVREQGKWKIAYAPTKSYAVR